MYEKTIGNTFTATYSLYDKFQKVASMLRAMVGHLSENSPDLVQNAVLGFPSDQSMSTASVKTVPWRMATGIMTPMSVPAVVTH